MSILIILLLWIDPSWNKIAIMILAAIIAIMSLWGGCCCKVGDKYCEDKK